MITKILSVKDFQNSFVEDARQSKYWRRFSRAGKVFIRFLDSDKTKRTDWIFEKKEFDLYIKPLLNLN